VHREQQAMGSGAASGSGYAAVESAPKQAMMTQTKAPVTGARVTDTLARLDATVGHKLIRHGDLRITVDSVDGARVKLEELADENGGFIDRSQIDHEDGKASRATIVLRIPAERFMDVMRGSRGLGQVDRDEAETEDVTQEYTDLAARLANTKRLEQRLLQLVDTRAGNMSEVLEVENQIAEVRGTIEQMEGRIRMWDDQITLSRITVELVAKHAPAPVVAKTEPPAAPSWWDRVSGAASSSVGALATAGTALAMGAAAALPWIPLALIALLLMRFAGRRISRIFRVRRMHDQARAERDAMAAGIAAGMEVNAAVHAE